MNPFFRKNNDKKPKIQGKESTVASNDLLTEGAEAPVEDEVVNTTLSLSDSWQLAKEDEYVFQFLNQECPPLKKNQVSLHGINLERKEDGYNVTAFVRNSVESPIQLNETTLTLLSASDEVLGKRQFQLNELGDIPAASSRPWEFFFPNDDALVNSMPGEGWQLAFEIKQEHALELDQNWEEALTPEAKQRLKDTVNKLGAPNEGEVNIMGLQAKFHDNDFHATLLFRNGSHQNVKVEELPLQIIDATGEIVASGGFKLDQFEVSANKTKPWTFIFPASLVQKKNPDLSRWKAISQN